MVNMKQIPQFLIASPCSGSGKTTVSSGLMAALVRRGLLVQPYKCGPDYIDTKFHTDVCQRPSLNLDTFMASPDHARQIYAHYASDADVCVIEGMMGLFDGYERDLGSSSEIAALLGLPVVLVVDARSAAYSTAALLDGFRRFRPDIHIAGVIFNKVGSPRHGQMLQETCADTGLLCLGCLPKDEAVEQKSRYLGLDFSQEKKGASMNYLAEHIERYIDISSLLQAVTRPLEENEFPFSKHQSEDLHIAVLRNNESFSFIYAEHLDILRQMGQVTFLDPEEDTQLPEGTDLLYLPGGYPEKHAARLSEAKDCMESIRDYIEQGGRALAECGGMIYLSQGIWFDESPLFTPLCGILPFTISNRKEERKLSLGYRQFQYRGQSLRGHEFHYTQFYKEDRSSLPIPIAQVYNARKQEVPTPIFRYKNLIASYTHLYWGEINLLQLFDKTENK